MRRKMVLPAPAPEILSPGSESKSRSLIPSKRTTGLPLKPLATNVGRAEPELVALSEAPGAVFTHDPTGLPSTRPALSAPLMSAALSQSWSPLVTGRVAACSGAPIRQTMPSNETPRNLADAVIVLSCPWTRSGLTVRLNFEISTRLSPADLLGVGQAGARATR